MNRNTVVVVEDEPSVGLAGADLFAAAGLELVEFADGDAAMDYLRDHKGDVAAVLTDVDLPGDTDGLELAGIVSAVCPDIAVLVTSGEPCGGRSPLGSQLGSQFGARGDLGSGVRYVAKPEHAADLLDALRDAMRPAA